MVQNKQIRNFLFLLSGIVLLFCGSIPNFAESVIALLRGLLSFINLGWIGTLLIISRVLLILGGTGRTRQTLWRAVQMLTQKLCCQTIHDCPKVVPLHYESE